MVSADPSKLLAMEERVDEENVWKFDLARGHDLDLWWYRNWTKTKH
jgi:hypothetical protein